MISISITSNVKAFRGFLGRFERRQLPFATAQALNATAFDVRRTIVDRTFPEAFTLRNKGFPRIMRVDKANKVTLQAGVFDSRGLDYLPKQDDGGTKRPRGRHIAVPQPGVRRGARGVTPRDRPRQAIASGKAFSTGTAIFRKTGRGGKKLKLLHVLTPKVRIPAILKFTEDATRVTTRVFDDHFVKAINRALRTAR